MQSKKSILSGSRGGKQKVMVCRATPLKRIEEQVGCVIHWLASMETNVNLAVERPKLHARATSVVTSTKGYGPTGSYLQPPLF